MPFLKALLSALLLFPAGLSAASPAASGREPNLLIEFLLNTPGLTIGNIQILAEEFLLEAYRDNGFRPLWTDREDIAELLELIEKAPAHGLNPEDYGLAELQELLILWQNEPTSEREAKAEILMTESLVRYAFHRRLGKVNAHDMDADINFRREAFSDLSALESVQAAMNAPSLQSFVDQIAPSGPYYQALQYWLEIYQGMQASGGWSPVPAGPTLRLGDRGSRVAALRARLAVSGEWQDPQAVDPSYFDRELETAVKAFQLRHALEADGLAGAQTVEAINVPIEARIDQLRASLERLRWVNQEADDTLVAVNIAGYRAMFFRQGRIIWTTRAMVGTNYRKTPIFGGDIAYMEFNPTWTIPPTILRNDTLPAIKRDPTYLERKNIRVIDRKGAIVDPATVDWSRYSTTIPYTLRQDPGPQNALGTVKFIFPNKHLVFLHDTPNTELFNRPERAFSSGCIRVEDPLRLAELLLDDADRYRRSDLQSIIDSRRTQRINLSPNIPVLIIYLTADIDNDGSVRFLKDIYDRDPAVLAALDGPVTIDPPEPREP